MHLNNRTSIIVGPPGTGKTTFLVDKIRELLGEGVRMADIGYISFTRQAVKEATERIKCQVEADEWDLIGFRTLHSMAYWLLGLHPSDILAPDAYREILPKPWPKSWLDRYVAMYQYSRVTGADLQKTWEAFNGYRVGTEEDFLMWVSMYKDLKVLRKKMDFMDIVQEFVRKDTKFPFQHLFIDEAQDFTPDQWEAVRLLAAQAGHVYVAGDPEQSIFQWAGAKRSILKSLQGNTTVLSTSYRIPSTVHEIAKRVLRITGEEILYAPRQAKGSVNILGRDLAKGLPFDNGESWFLLCRDSYQVEDVKKMLWGKGVYHTDISIKDFGKGTLDKNVSRVKQWEKIAIADNYDGRSIRGLAKDCISSDLIEQAFRRKLPWYLAFDQWSYEKINYYRANERIWRNGTAPVKVGTMHSCKGAEADNVVIFTATNLRCRSNYDNNSMEEWRLLYVAVTRAKKNLFFATGGRYEIPLDMVFPLGSALADSEWMNTYDLRGLHVQNNPQTLSA